MNYIIRKQKLDKFKTSIAKDTKTQLKDSD